MPDAQQKLLLQTIHFLSEKFKEKFVLAGGMLLCLLNSPRSTQDIDCFFLSKVSKKVLGEEIRKALKQFALAKVTSFEINSRGIFVGLQGETADEKIRLEMSVVASLNLPTESFATTTLASSYAMGARVIQVIALPEAFANKIAACIERENMRDLYDITLFEPLCTFDPKTMQERLKKSSIRRQKPVALDFKKAASLLKKRVESLTEKKLEEELYPLLPATQQTSMLRIIQSSLAKVIQRLEQMD
ncbi:MAG: nucleotidyl transferase AbiEii/AbiGii toxin family protein [Deltaproteobacteria bacterium]|nr:nucleotidyl transferase AbiEii/AbiGii toxin family protein [Deltaproteobacteria bacterium]